MHRNNCYSKQGKPTMKKSLILAFALLTASATQAGSSTLLTIPAIKVTKKNATVVLGVATGGIFVVKSLSWIQLALLGGAGAGLYVLAKKYNVNINLNDLKSLKKYIPSS